jgi:hypothetical protein
MIMAAPPAVGREALSEPERPAALDHHRSSHHDGRGHRDFEQKPNYKYHH